ncbi:lipopolysaccharide biosynthesis protein [Plantactinospora sp. GCM10030261]|uniref:lipopolysaccharide biosynthesis protein n=1 Tax=Plantactinospora sp. GCM10030261 TaxID=3273420 RepID=UPI00360F4333
MIRRPTAGRRGGGEGSKGTTVPTQPSGAPVRVRLQTAATSSATLLAGVVNAAILALSARFGQTEEIGAYTVMTAALAWVSIILVGGSSMLYLSGSEAERHAVRSQRLLVAVPVLAAATMVVAVAYSGRGYSLFALVAAGVTAIGNNLFELQSADLARQLRSAWAALVMCVTKLLALVMVLAGLPLTAALAIATLVLLAAAEALCCRGAAGRRPLWRNLSARSGLAAFRLNRQLFVYSGAEAFVSRVPTLMLSLVSTPVVMGCFGAVVGIYQALASVPYSGLRTSAAMRARHRHDPEMRSTQGYEGEILMAAVAAIIAIGTVLTAPWVTELLRLPMADSTLWLRLLILAMPFLVITRAVSLNLIVSGDHRSAVRNAVLVAVLTGLALAAQLPGLTPTEAAATTLAVEMTNLPVLVAVTVLARRRKRRGPPTPRGRHRTGTATTPVNAAPSVPTSFS